MTVTQLKDSPLGLACNLGNDLALSKCQEGVKISGALVKQTAAMITIGLDDMQLEISTNEVLAIQENTSIPATSDDSIRHVDLVVAPSAQVIEHRVRTARDYGDWLGKRPFVYELPSLTTEFAVSDKQYQTQQQWLEQVGLSEFLTIAAGRQTNHPTSSNTPYNTYNQTARGSYNNTSTPRDSRSDSSTDYSGDNQSDSRGDMQTDSRYDA